MMEMFVYEMGRVQATDGWSCATSRCGGQSVIWDSTRVLLPMSVRRPTSAEKVRGQIRPLTVILGNVPKK